MHPASLPFFISAFDMSRCIVASGVGHLGDHLIHLLHMSVGAQIARGKSRRKSHNGHKRAARNGVLSMASSFTRELKLLLNAGAQELAVTSTNFFLTPRT